MDGWWMDGQMSGCLYWDVTVGLYKGRLLFNDKSTGRVATATTGTGNNLKICKKDSDKMGRVAVLRLETANSFLQMNPADSVHV